VSKRKEQLLLAAEHAADYINKTGSGTFVSFILDMIACVSETAKPDADKVQDLYKMLYHVKSSSLESLGGGRRLKQAYIDFVDNFLRLSKAQHGSAKYSVRNEEFNGLSLSELHYVFGWVRRLVKAENIPARSSVNKSPQKYREEAAGNHSMKANDGLFNTQLRDQPEKLKGMKKGF